MESLSVDEGRSLVEQWTRGLAAGLVREDAPLMRVTGIVVARRQHGKALVFLDVATTETCTPDSHHLHVVVEGDRWMGHAEHFTPLVNLLQPPCNALFEGFPGMSRGGRKPGCPSLYAVHVRLLRCMAHPAAVLRVLRVTRSLPDALTIADAAIVLQCSDEHVNRLCVLQEAVEVGSLPDERLNWRLRRESARLSRILAGEEKAGFWRGRRRRPHLTPTDVALLASERLDAIRKAWPLVSCTDDGDDDDDENENGEDLWCRPLGVLDPLNNIPNRYDEERSHYAETRKRPQVRWMLAKLEELLLDVKEQGQGVWIVDVGGGRGDLALNIAQTFPRVHIAVVDVNEVSLEAGRRCAREAELNNVSFYRADILASAEDPRIFPPSREMVVLVGLHTCGGLSDAILYLARMKGAAFLCCTCCFCKNHDLRLVVTTPERGKEDEDDEFNAPSAWWGLTFEEGQRLCCLAEMDSDREVARQAMHALNALRMSWFATNGTDARNLKDAAILAMPESFTPRNLVLRGRFETKWEDGRLVGHTAPIVPS